MKEGAAEAPERVRVPCLDLAGTSERLSHGGPTFFIRGERSFATFVNHHHGAGRLAVHSAAPGRRHGGRRPSRMGSTALIAGHPDRFFVPPYVVHFGSVDVRLEGAQDWEEITGVMEDPYATRRRERP